MENQELTPKALHRDFESIKKTDENGYEFWEARELMPLLGYQKWQNAHAAIKRAMVACDSSDQVLEDHFTSASKMIKIAKNTAKETLRSQQDYRLSRLACYLIAQNGDPRKSEVAFAQTYFAVQTRKQELLESMDDDGKRLFTRQQVTSHNNQLAETAQQVGVENFGRFNNAGYQGLYGGLTAKQIQEKKGIGKDAILDRAGTSELAANLFRITQTDDKLQRDAVSGEDEASMTHFEVGRSVRKAIKDLGGTMPEELPPEEHIQSLAKRKVGQLPKRVQLKPGPKTKSKD